MLSYPDLSQSFRSRQRQTVLNLCYLKLQTPPRTSEPGLARWVLISNTLRLIQDDLRGEKAPQRNQEGIQDAEESLRSLPHASSATEVPALPKSVVFSTVDVFTDSVPSDAPRSSDLELTLAPPSDTAHSFLADFSLDDFLLSEIDSFLLDGFLCGSSSGTSKGVSTVTEDIIKTVSGSNAGGHAGLLSNQTFRLDLNELDHIMEVLVGS
ncbi:hypothetical protein DNTS_030179 [Danionella cerebrum]|uniref:SERTA domain-containing protein n=1 Tax=Danionella cerebrum TaxID=2873325 RepID=A0A553Q835_9TELE|nr:hypothetical protein DNTS_030179 [Danionella translucida]